MDKEKLLHKWLNENATPEETSILLEDSEYSDYLKIAGSASGMELPEFDRDRNLQAILDRRAIQPKVRRLNPLAKILKAVAIAAVVIAAYFFVTNLDTKITTQVAQKEEFQLPDGSEVSLNSDSRIVYNKKDWGTNRNLSLEGEAYFKVAKGEKFSVVTPDGTVSVLGTQFNVYTRNNTFDIRCFEGLVSVSYADTIVNVPAGNLLRIEDNRLVGKSRILETAPSWITNESSFVNAPIAVVLEELQRQYPIVITAPDMVNKRFSGSFTHTDLQVALRSICDPLQLEFNIEGNQVSIDAQSSN